MIYFLQSACISPQKRESDGKEGNPRENWLTVVEPTYKNIAKGKLRRMGKALRIGVGSALPILETHPDCEGIIIGTSNGGMDDSIRFLNQVIEYDEGTLTPTNFVQSTSNAIAGQIALTANKTGYNTTHVHRGLAFENALLDACFLCAENPSLKYLVGGVEEISKYNFNIDYLARWYKHDFVSVQDLYQSETKGSLSGEGAAMFAVSDNPVGAQMQMVELKTVSTDDINVLTDLSRDILAAFDIDILLSGENGDIRFREMYESIEQELNLETGILRYKHYCGEYPTSSSFAVWAIMELFKNENLPDFFNVKRNSSNLKRPERVLFYNAYQGRQHSFMVFEKA